jgi:NADH-quinone oxidoreductase subunit M
VIFAAVYLLWAYQRVIYGEATRATNRALPDCSPRERLIFWPLCIMILWMGVASPLFLSRTETATQTVLELMKRPQPPALARGRDVVCCAPSGAKVVSDTPGRAGTK